MTDKKQKIREINEIIETILLAIPREISARKSYLTAYSKATSERARLLFMSLANDEKKHEEALRDILDKLKTELDQLTA